MAEAQWYYTRGGQQAGPVSGEQLRQMAASGQLAPTELVWREGMANWQPVGSVAELGASPAATSAPPANPYAPSYPQPGAGYPPGYQQMGYAPAGQSYSGMAIAALVVGLVGLACGGLILGIVAIILAASAIKGMKRSGNMQGKGMATAGLVLGIIDIVGGAIFAMYWVGHMHHAVRHGGF